tara:strand:- start:100 stop:612 length:513 start_codon:yes stop_codon:yes gene_type:complete
MRRVSWTQACKKSLNFAYIIFAGILISGCASANQKLNTEIITVPRIPEEIKDIPISEIDFVFNEIPSKESVRTSVQVGRKDPFLPPLLDLESMASMPNDFQFDGIMKLNGIVRALVSNDSFSGSIFKGNLGGRDTKLIPDGWIVEDVNDETEELIFSFNDQRIVMKLLYE